MNPRDFISFFKTRSGKIIAFGALLSAALVIFSVVRKHHTSTDDAIAPNLPNVTDKPEVVQSVQRPLDVFRPSQSRTQPASLASSASTTSPRTPANVYAQQAELPSISLFADSTAGVARPKKLGAVFAPFGRLIPCETIITVDSSSIQTPIIGLVTANVYFHDRLVIPAGTEVHGTAQADHQRERIASGNSWTLVWQDGKEMQIKAIVLDREFESSTNQSGWAVTDGSAGLRGEVIKSDNFADLKLFAATFLSGAASALTEQQQTVFGPVNSPSLNNAPFQGAQAVLQTYAQQIYDSIQKNGFYVRVPSGKQFYLYVLQTIDTANASLGGTAIPVTEDKDEQPTTTPPR
jgi:type F conjugative transfer system protein TrbI